MRRLFCGILIGILSSAEASAWTMVSTHPRLWLTASRLTRIQTARTNNTTRWQNVKANADSGAALSDTNSDVINYLPALAMAYQAGAGNSYGDKAISVMLAHAIETGTCPVSGGSTPYPAGNGCHFGGGDYYDFRDGIFRIAMAMDYAYDRMTAGQRQTVATWLMNRVDEMWPESSILQVSSLTSAGTTATVATATAHLLVTGTPTAIYGASPSTYNRTDATATVTDSTHFTYVCSSTCGTSPATGTITLEPRKGHNAVSDPANNYYLAFYMGAWAAAVAAYGDDTGTSPISGSGSTARASYHIDLLKSKLSGTFVPFVTSPRNTAAGIYTGWGVGGLWAEGTNYETSHFLGAALDAHLTGTGEDLINDGGALQNFFRDTLYWRIYSTIPALTHHYHLGDQPADAAGILRFLDRWRALVVMQTLNNTTLVQQSKWWLDHITTNLTTDRLYNTWELLYYDTGASSSDYTATLATSYYATGPGLLVNRSGWGSTATYFGIWAGGVIEGHQMQDANGFLVYKGDWLIANANMYSNNGIEQQTDRHNNYTLDDVAVSVTSSSVAGNSVITTAAAHGLAVRDYVKIAGHTGATPDINSDATGYTSGQVWRIGTVPSSTTFTIPATVSVGGSGGTATRTNLQVVEDSADAVTPWPSDVASMLKQEATSEFTLFEGQAAKAYVHDKSHGGFNRLTDYARKLVYINALDSFVLYDRVSNVTASLAKVLHLQSKNSPTIATRRFNFANATYKACGDAVLPSADVTVTSAAWNMGASNSSYQTLITVNGNRTTDYVLTTAQLVTSGASCPAAPAAVSELNGRMDGVEVGSWVVMLGRTELVTLPVHFSTTAATELLVTDLKTSTAYSVVTRDTGNNVLRTLSLTTTAQGSLRVTAQAAERTFDVTEGPLPVGVFGRLVPK